MAITIAQIRQIAKLPAVDVLPDANVQNYLNASQVVFDSIPSGSGWSTAKAELVQLYLAAHFAVLSEEYGGLSQQVVGESEERYQTLEGRDEGLATTRFGKTAIALDDSGYLGSLSAKPVRALFRVYDEAVPTSCESES